MYNQLKNPHKDVFMNKSVLLLSLTFLVPPLSSHAETVSQTTTESSYIQQTDIQLAKRKKKRRKGNKRKKRNPSSSESGGSFKVKQGVRGVIGPYLGTEIEDVTILAMGGDYVYQISENIEIIGGLLYWSTGEEIEFNNGSITYIFTALAFDGGANYLLHLSDSFSLGFGGRVGIYNLSAEITYEPDPQGLGATESDSEFVISPSASANYHLSQNISLGAELRKPMISNEDYDNLKGYYFLGSLTYYF